MLKLNRKESIRFLLEIYESHYTALKILYENNATFLEMLEYCKTFDMDSGICYKIARIKSKKNIILFPVNKLRKNTINCWWCIAPHLANSKTELLDSIDYRRKALIELLEKEKSLIYRIKTYLKYKNY